MKPNSHIQTAIEILNNYRPTHGPLAPRIKKELKNRRYAGSKDRRAITNIVYEVMRRAPLLLETLEMTEWTQENGRSLMISYLTLFHGDTLNSIFSGEINTPPALSEEEQILSTKILAHSPSLAAQHWMSPWLFEELQKTCDMEDLKKLQEQAPFDLRINGDRPHVKDTLEAEGVEVKETSFSPMALRILDKTNIQNNPLFKKGHIDIQEESSQILALLCKPENDIKILDLCAGAGGKSFAIASLCPTASITATDIDPRRLKIARERAKQQNFKNIEFIEYKQFMSDAAHINWYDLVLVDAPCSGTGILRRHPEFKILLSPEKLNEYIKTQQKILMDAQRFVADKGRLIYATCSLLKSENQDQALWFIKENPFFSLVNTAKVCDKVLKETPKNTDTFLELHPGKHETDGFFTAIFDKD